MVKQSFKPAAANTLHKRRAAARTPQSLWFSRDASRAHYEKLSLIWAPLVMFVLLVFVLGTPLYKWCDRNAYLAISVVGCLPGFVVPLWFPCEHDARRVIWQRFWLKGSAWIAVFGFYGNYFWTHYFYHLLGARYLFDAHRVNDVPLVCFTCTFFYFTFYFNFASVVLRRLWFGVAHLPPHARLALWYSAVCVLSYATAVFEAVSIQHFPLYAVHDRRAFVTIGSLFYALYFVVGFPMFLSLGHDDDARHHRAPCTLTLWQTVVNACAASAMVTLLLDVWRLRIGSLDQVASSAAGYALPFVYQSNASVSSHHMHSL